MRDGKVEVGDVLRIPCSGEERIVVQVWSGKDIVIPYPITSRGLGLEERSALFAVTRARG